MEDEKLLNPYINIWIRPRRTIQSQVSKKQKNGFFFLCFLVGLVFLFGFSQVLTLGFYMSFFWMLVFCFFLSVIFGYFLFSIGAFFIFVTGKLLNGKGRYKEIRLAVAWSNFPIIISFFIWIVLVFLYKQNVFIDFPGPLILSENEVIFIFSLMALQLIVYIWIIILLIQTISQVQDFSTIKSILNIILASFLSGIVFSVLYIGFLWIIAFLKN